MLAITGKNDYKRKRISLEEWGAVGGLKQLGAAVGSCFGPLARSIKKVLKKVMKKGKHFTLRKKK